MSIKELTKHRWIWWQSVYNTHNYIKLEKTLVHVFHKQRRVKIKINNRFKRGWVSQRNRAFTDLSSSNVPAAASIWVIQTPTPTTSKWVDQALPCRVGIITNPGKRLLYNWLKKQKLMIFKHGMTGMIMVRHGVSVTFLSLLKRIFKKYQRTI